MMEKQKLMIIWRRIWPQGPKPYYTSCRDMPLENFMWCLAKGDVKFLMKPGKRRVSNKILEPVWEDIFYEYLDLSGDGSYKKVLALMREITVLDTRYILVYEIVRQMRYRPSKVLAGHLRKLGYRFAYDPSDRMKYLDDLSKTLSRSKSLSMQAKDKKRELIEARIRESRVKGMDDYEEMLADLSKFQGYRINPKEVSVSEFIAIVKRYKKHAESLKKKPANGKFRKN